MSWRQNDKRRDGDEENFSENWRTSRRADSTQGSLYRGRGDYSRSRDFRRGFSSRGRGRGDATNNIIPSNRDNSRHYQSKLSHRFLSEILSKDTDGAIMELYQKVTTFSQNLIENVFSSEEVKLLLRVLSQKLCSETTLTEMRNKLLMKVCCDEFLKTLKSFTFEIQLKVTEMEETTLSSEMSSLLEIFNDLLKFYTYIWTTMPNTGLDRILPLVKAAEITLVTVVAAISPLPPEFEIAKENFRLLNKNITAQKTKINQKLNAKIPVKTSFLKGKDAKLYLEEPPDDFKTMAIIPQRDELLDDRIPYLRPNIVNGHYPSAEVYLDVQFRLLREDFVGPLRIAVNYYMDKKMLTGNLLCLTANDFATTYYGTIVSRKIEDLKRGFVDVIWETGDRPKERKSNGFTMLECDVYFEAYRHTLKALQEMEISHKCPLTTYIIGDSEFEERVPPPPLYIEDTEKYLCFDVFSLEEKDLQEDQEGLLEQSESKNSVNKVVSSNDKIKDTDSKESISVDLDSKDLEKLEKLPVDGKEIRSPKLLAKPLEFRHWPTASQLSMDDSQYAAFRGAVTRDLAIIQGPPGTGKTYIGLQIAKLILTNQDIYKSGSPILVVCYTNHALDQFLEGIIDVMENLAINPSGNIIRIGSRSNSEKLQKLGIYERRQEAITKQEFPYEYRITRRDIVETLNDLQRNRKNMMEELREMKGKMSGIVDFENLTGLHFVELKKFQFLKTIDEAALGIKDSDFKGRNYSPIIHLRKWFKINKESTDNQWRRNINHNSATNSNEQLKENGSRDEILESEGNEDYNRDELIERRMDIMIELQSAPTNDRYKRKPIYSASPEVIEDKIVKNERVIIQSDEELQYMEQNAQKLTHLSFVRSQTTKKMLLDAIQAAQTQNQLLRNKQIFLQSLFENYYSDKLILPTITAEFVETLKEDISKFFRLNHSERWAVYFHFISMLEFPYLNAIANLEKRIIEEQANLQQINRKGESYLLNEAVFVGMTTTGAAKYNSLLRLMKSQIVIVEEAGEVLESHIVTSITEHCQHLILIGDHKQLRPSINYHKLSTTYNMDISLFERMINNGVGYFQLEVQHRMRPNICGLLVPTIYEKLIHHESVFQYPPSILGLSKTLYFIDHKEFEDADLDSATKTNAHEAKVLIKLCRYLILQGYNPRTITILTTYIGQMFHLKNLQREEGDACGKVRVTVVDNFQGEENEIILLSLVRSNAENKIGFLKTDNRICVALSRAKHGFFVMGNMEALTASGSPTWKNIRKYLEVENCIGEKLPLKCEVHGDITLIQTGEDFYKVPEGGCSKMCDEKLICGHKCQRICHPTDRDHKEYKCMLPCPRNCEREHPCKLFCYEDCFCRVDVPKTLACGHVTEILCSRYDEPYDCIEIVKRQLLCGHETDLRCHIDVDSYDCVEKVEKSLPCEHTQIASCFEKEETIQCLTKISKNHPKCEHTIEIECHKKNDVAEWKCTSQCDTRLDCGHACFRKCHFDNDPEHKKYFCKEECRRTCEFGHSCQGIFPSHRCQDPCAPCEVKDNKLLKCGHEMLLQCSIIPTTVKCQTLCEKLLPCGHKCQEKCHEECICKVLKKKQSLDCVHEVEVPCATPPLRQYCEQKIVSPIPSLCGHTVFIPCKLAETATPENILRFCNEPCGKILGDGPDDCGHACSGNCFSCSQGRIHEKCGEKCGRTLVCGHICKHPCSLLCPPCEEKCECQCEHSKCKKNCGVPCINCNMFCKSECKHSSCQKLCSEECNREPCIFPCEKVLNCGHNCIGLCGELCPPFCRVCDKDKVEEFFITNEIEENSRFVYLEDCEHVIEVEDMDSWMQVELEEGVVAPKRCPRCRTIIKNCGRYKSIFIRKLKDIVAVKAQIFGRTKGIEDKQWEIVTELHEARNCEVLQSFRDFLQNKTYAVEHTERKKDSDIELKKLDQYMFESVQHMFFWWSAARENVLKFNKLSATLSAKNKLEAMHTELFQNVAKRKFPLSRREIADFSREFDKAADYYDLCRRYAVFFKFGITDANILKSYIRTDKFFKKIIAEPYTDFRKTELLNLLKDLDSMLGKFVNSEAFKENERKVRQEVVQAAGFGANHWYKCPEGHYYVIADCGRPNETAKCPECKSSIGAAGYHILAEGNEAAGSELLTGDTEPSKLLKDIDFLSIE